MSDRLLVDNVLLRSETMKSLADAIYYLSRYCSDSRSTSVSKDALELLQSELCSQSGLFSEEIGKVEVMNK